MKIRVILMHDGKRRAYDVNPWNATEEGSLKHSAFAAFCCEHSKTAAREKLVRENCSGCALRRFRQDRRGTMVRPPNHSNWLRLFIETNRLVESRFIWDAVVVKGGAYGDAVLRDLATFTPVYHYTGQN